MSTWSRAGANGRALAQDWRRHGPKATGREVFAQLKAAADAARFGLLPSAAGASLGPALPLPASEDGSIITARFASGLAALEEPIPSDRNLRNRYRYYLDFLTLVGLVAPNLEGSVRVHLRDGHPPEPVHGDRIELVFNRRRGASSAFVVVPDAHFVKHYGYARLRRRVCAHRPAWSERRPVAYWRGSSTGGSLGQGEDVMRNGRVKLCMTALEHPLLVDAKLGRVVDCHPDSEALLVAKGLVDDFLAEHQQLAARYLISIDGWAGEWSGMAWKLASGSVVLMVESDWEQWYQRRLEPYRHYVPVRRDLSDLATQVEWCRDHDDECRAIASAAEELMRTEVTFAESVRFTREQLGC
jgi:hypothetical protein